MFAVDAGSTQGVAEVMKESNLPSKGVHGGGFDLLPRTVELIHDGFLDFTIDQQPYLQGFYTVMEMFMFLASGGLVGPANINTGLKFVTKGSVDPYLTTSTRYEGKSDKAADRAAHRCRSRADVFRDGRRTAARPRRWSAALAGGQHPCWSRLLLIAYFETANHDFLLTSASLENLSQFIAPVAIIACGEIMLMIGGEIDLSAGMVFAFAPFIMHFADEAGVPVIVALLAGCSRPAWSGWSTASVTVYLRIPSFVTTLGTLFLVNGLTLTISRGTPVSPPGGEAFAQVMGAWGYSEILWASLVVVVLHVVLRHTRWGLHTIASGANRDRRERSGHSRHAPEARQLHSGCAAGRLHRHPGGFRIGSIDPQAGGNQIMFLAVAAAVIGGTPLAGGSGTIIGGLIGAAVLGVLNDGFTLIGINAFTFNMILGAAILAAMLFNIHVTRLAREGEPR